MVDPDERTQLTTEGGGRGGAAGGPGTPYPPTIRETRQPGKRRMGWAIGVAVAVAAILAAVLLVVLPGGGEGTKPFELPAAGVALSNDTVVYASQREGGKYSIFSGRIGDGLLTEEKKITSGGVDGLLPVIVPGRKTVLYYRNTSPGSLYAIAADGSGEPVQLLTTGPAANLSIADDARPSVSPDGKFLVIRSTTDETGVSNPGLYVMRMDGTGIRRLATKPQATDPAWSPDGERIAYWSSNSGGDGGFIVVIPVAVGGTPTPITSAKGPDLDADPAWSPDGNRIVFRRAEGGDLNNKEIWIMNPDGSNQKPLTDLNSAQDPTFSPRLPGNTSQLVFTAPRSDGDRELYVMKDINKPDQIQQLTERGGNDTQPRWNSG